MRHLLYIDPGTGSMLFTVIIGLLSAVIYFFRGAFVKLRFCFKGGSSHDRKKETLPYVFFTDSKRYYSIFKPLCDEMEARKQKVTYMTASRDDPILKEQYNYIKTEFIGEGNKAFARMNLLQADIVLSSTPGLDVYQWKRSRDVKYYVHIIHMANDITSYKMFGLDYYDAVLISGEYQEKQIRSLEGIRNLPQKEVRLVGLPQFDALKERLIKEGKTNNEIPIIALAPTWGASSLFNRYGGLIIEKLLDTDYHIIIRPHPQSYSSEKELIERLMSKYPNNDRLEWDSRIDNFETLNRADVLISDFSGVIFDYSLVFEKPVIYAEVDFDKGPYDAWWLDEEMWTFQTLPNLGVQLTRENIDKIDDIIKLCLSDKRFSRGREQAVSETWGNKGNSINAISDYLIDKKECIIG